MPCAQKSTRHRWYVDDRRPERRARTIDELSDSSAVELAKCMSPFPLTLSLMR